MVLEMTDAKNVSLREMVEHMGHMKDSDAFRWFQDSYVASDGSIHAGDTLLVTMGQARVELGIGEKP